MNYLYGWPSTHPQPTEAQMDAARQRYAAEIEEWERETGKVCSSDWGCGLDFVMATYARECWWDLFFPDDRL